MKSVVLETLGEAGLALPAQIDAGLAANDRLKYYFSLLQVARDHADQPAHAASSLKHERIQAGIHDASLDDVVAAAHMQGAAYRMPRCTAVLAAIRADAKCMAAPAQPAIKGRLDGLLAALPQLQDGLIGGAAIDGITRAGRRHGDSLHQLVMDLHKILNGLQATLAAETIGGAATYALGPGDAALVTAFMAGVNRTAGLKFDHPGLAATATRSGGRLVIQNDIGTTDAHVIVIHIEGHAVSLTYSDVHIERLRFFRGLLDPFQVTWSTPGGNQVPSLAGGEMFFLSTGTFAAKDDNNLLAYLDHLGSRLVFLIDWNHARKQLRGFLEREQRVALLRWAADNDIGHRAFLQLGGKRLIWAAVEATASGAVHFGDRLSDVLGPDAAFAFVQFVFTTATKGLIAHQSDGLIHDRIRAELLDRLHSAKARLLGITADHAAFVFEIAAALRDHVFGPAPDVAALKDLEKHGRHWEHAADQLVFAMTEAVQRRPELSPLLASIDAADDAADSLEEATFLLSLLDGDANHRALQPLQPLAAILADSAQEWVKAVGHAQHVKRHGLRDDADDFFQAIDRLAALEHDADDAERSTTVMVMKAVTDFRTLHVMSEIWHGLGEASDSLKRASLLLRSHVVSDVLAT